MVFCQGDKESYRFWNLVKAACCSGEGLWGNCATPIEQENSSIKNKLKYFMI